MCHGREDKDGDLLLSSDRPLLPAITPSSTSRRRCLTDGVMAAQPSAVVTGGEGRVQDGRWLARSVGDDENGYGWLLGQDGWTFDPSPLMGAVASACRSSARSCSRSRSTSAHRPSFTVSRACATTTLEHLGAVLWEAPGALPWTRLHRR